MMSCCKRHWMVDLMLHCSGNAVALRRRVTGVVAQHVAQVGPSAAASPLEVAGTKAAWAAIVQHCLALLMQMLHGRCLQLRPAHLKAIIAKLLMVAVLAVLVATC